MTFQPQVRASSDLLQDGTTEGRQHYFVMPYYPRGNLYDAIVQRRRQFSLPELVAIITTVGRTLAHVHSRKMVHRDVKPSNILLGDDGSALLTDFDIVQAPLTTGMSRTGAHLGTFIYAAPEVLSGPTDPTAF